MSLTQDRGSEQEGTLLKSRDGSRFLIDERVGTLTSFERSVDLNRDRTRVREATREVIGWSSDRL